MRPAARALAAAALAGVICGACGTWLPSIAAADPVLNAITPAYVAGNNGSTVTLTGAGFGAADDRVYFEDSPGQGRVPIAWAAGSLTIKVPNTSSGQVWVKSHGLDPASNSKSLEISWIYEGHKWLPNALPFTWFMQRDGAPGCDIVATANALKAGYDTWSCASGISMTYGGRTTTAVRSFDGFNVQFWSHGMNPNYIATTSVFTNDTTGAILETDIEYNADAGSWGVPTDGLKLDVQNIATHEEGHSIGFLDMYGPFDSGKTMFGNSGGGETSKRTLSVSDVEGAEWMYPHAGRANLAPGTPGGWSGAIVPRNTGDATGGSAPLPAALTGNATDYVNAAMANAGSDCASPYFSNKLMVDDVPIATTTHLGPWPAGGPGSEWLNLAHDFTGGRHTITVALDTAQDVVESNEADNMFATQFVWSPLALSTGTGVFRSAPPPPGLLAQPNSDGLSYTRTTGFAWVVSEAPINVGDDYDLYAYDDYSGSTSGYSNLIKISAAPGNQTDFVVGHFAGTPITVYPGIVRNSIAGGGGPYSADGRDAVGRNDGSGEMAWLAQTLSGGRLADVYEGNFIVGQTYYIALVRTSGPSDIAFTVYPGIGGGVYSRLDGAGTPSLAATVDLDTLKFTSAETGWHPVVVYRDNGAAITSSVVYDLRWSTHPVVAVPALRTSYTLTFAGARPNPAMGRTALEFTLAESGPVRLELFDVLGRSVRTLVAGSLDPGVHTVEWDGRDRDGAPAGLGLYLARLETRGRVFVRRVTLLR